MQSKLDNSHEKNQNPSSENSVEQKSFQQLSLKL